MNLKTLMKLKAALGGGGGTFFKPKNYSATAVWGTTAPTTTNTRGTTISTTSGEGGVTVTQSDYNPGDSLYSYTNGQMFVIFEGLKEMMSAGDTLVFSASISVTDNPASTDSFRVYTNGNGSAVVADFTTGKLNFTIKNNVREEREYLEFRVAGCSFTLSNVKLIKQ